MKTILYQPLFINPQAYFVFPQLYNIEKGDQYIEPAVYTGQLLIDVLTDNTFVTISDTNYLDFSEFAGKRIRISQYTDTGAFIFELLRNSTNDQCRSFGTLSSILVEKSDSISYQTSTSYNGTNITKGTGTDTDILYLGNARKNDNRYLYGAIYYFALYDKSLTPDEIEQEKIKLNEIWTKRLNR